MSRRRFGFWVPCSVAVLVVLAASQFIIRGAQGSTPPLSFLAPQSFTVGSLPFNVVLGDFNGDKILDMAVANSNPGTATISVLMGKGNGTFGPQTTYAVGNSSTAILAADFNGDHILDLAVANELGRGANQALSILIGKGDGTFKPAVNYPGGMAPRGISVGDFNKDGFLDIVVVNNDGNNVSLYLGKGDGTFQAPVYYPTHTHPKASDVGDFNRDGNLDLAVANHDTNDVSIMFGDGKGHFAAPVNYAVGLNPRDVHVANLRGITGETDIVTADGGTTTISVLMGNSNGTFQPAKHYLAGNSPRWIAIADYNGDGLLDVAASDYGGSSVDVLLGNGDGTFGAVNPLSVQANPCGVQAGDVNGDGKQDIVVAIGGLPTAPNDQVSVLVNTPTVATLSASPTSVKFGTRVIGSQSAPVKVTVTNPGTSAAGISSIVFTGAQAKDFLQTNNCGTSLAAGGSCTVNVSFLPHSVNLRSANLTVTPAAGSPLNVPVSGTGTAAAITPVSLAFPTRQVGTTSPASVVTLTNASTANAIAITSIKILGADPGDFAETTTCGATLAPKASCTTSVTFHPTVLGARSASLTFADNAGGGSQSVPLSGTGH